LSPVISLAVEQAKRDIDATCHILDISPGEARHVFGNASICVFAYDFSARSNSLYNKKRCPGQRHRITPRGEHSPLGDKVRPWVQTTPCLRICTQIH
jgi:hypothetical protein